MYDPPWLLTLLARLHTAAHRCSPSPSLTSAVLYFSNPPPTRHRHRTLLSVRLTPHDTAPTSFSVSVAATPMQFLAGSRDSRPPSPWGRGGLCGAVCSLGTLSQLQYLRHWSPSQSTKSLALPCRSSAQASRPVRRADCALHSTTQPARLPVSHSPRLPPPCIPVFLSPCLG